MRVFTVLEFVRGKIRKVSRGKLEKLFELCPLMQTVMPHENDVG